MSIIYIWTNVMSRVRPSWQVIFKVENSAHVIYEINVYHCHRSEHL